MKKQIILLFIVFLINNGKSAGLTKEEAKNKILTALRNAGSRIKYRYPVNYQKYLTDLTSTTIVKFDQILHSKIESLKTQNFFSHFHISLSFFFNHHHVFSFASFNDD